jgi:hypothetical protein
MIGIYLILGCLTLVFVQWLMSGIIKLELWEKLVVIAIWPVYMAAIIDTVVKYFKRKWFK